MSAKNYFQDKTQVIIEFKQTSLACSDLPLRERLEKNVSVLSSACGDVASMLVVHPLKWEAEVLRNNTLFVLAKISFEEVKANINEISSETRGHLIELEDQLSKLFNWLSTEADSKDDVRQAVALTHGIACALQREICMQNRVFIINPELQAYWQQYLVDSENGNFDHAFEMWKINVTTK